MRVPNGIAAVHTTASPGPDAPPFPSLLLTGKLWPWLYEATVEPLASIFTGRSSSAFPSASHSANTDHDRGSSFAAFAARHSAEMRDALAASAAADAQSLFSLSPSPPPQSPSQQQSRFQLRSQSLVEAVRSRNSARDASRAGKWVGWTSADADSATGGGALTGDDAGDNSDTNSDYARSNTGHRGFSGAQSLRNALIHGRRGVAGRGGGPVGGAAGVDAAVGTGALSASPAVPTVAELVETRSGVPRVCRPGPRNGLETTPEDVAYQHAVVAAAADGRSVASVGMNGGGDGNNRGSPDGPW